MRTGDEPATIKAGDGVVPRRPDARWLVRAHAAAGVAVGCCFPLVAWVLDLLLHGGPWSAAGVWQRHLDNPIHWIVDSAPLVLGTLGYAIGALQRHITSRERRFRVLVQHASDVIAVVDRGGTLCSLTPSLTAVFGYDPDELVGTPLQEWLHPEDAARVPALLAAVAARPAGTAGPLIGWRLRHRDGTWRDAEVIAENLLAEPDITGLVLTARDVTERRSAESSLRRANDEAGEANERLRGTLAQLESTQRQVVQQERLRALGQMASGIAHDFNNALAPVVGFSELLLAHPERLADVATSRRYLELMHTGARDAAAVVDRLKEFYRHRDGVDLRGPVDLPRTVEQVIALTQPRWKDQALASGRTVELVTELQPVPPVTGEETDLRELLTNLIFNAVDALLAGGTITLRTRLEQNRVILEVSDTGTGMTEEVRQRCLEPFFTTKGERGTGMGLATVYGIVQRHDGTVEVESEPGRGTTIRLSFPVHVGKAAATGVGRAPLATTVGALRVLVVDDEPLVREVTAAYLTSDGHTAEQVAGAHEALAVFRPGHFDVVLMDYAMPEMRGDLLASTLKRIDPATPIVLLTGFGGLMVSAGEQPAGVDAVLGKPIVSARLRETLHAVVTLARTVMPLADGSL
ncbi:MAG: ATP-binding protein [Chloroflexota bacterium]|nr:ATP-binding protein [Chloroflexota bacterium]